MLQNAFSIGRNFFSRLFAILCCVIFLTAVTMAQALLPECIKYEVHERARAEPSQVQVLAENCLSTRGYLDSYESTSFKRPGPVTLNTTFECCANKSCQNDLDCPFNFLCNRAQQRCVVANCELTDEVDLILNEGQECDIDDDCTFAVPGDASNWKCIAAPCPGGNCISQDKCKRCSKARPSRLVPPEPASTSTVSSILVTSERPTTVRATTENSTGSTNVISSTTVTSGTENVSAVTESTNNSSDENLTAIIASDNELNNSIPDTILTNALAALISDLVDSNATEVTTILPLDPESTTTLNDNGNFILDNGTIVEEEDPPSTTTFDPLPTDAVTTTAEVGSTEATTIDTGLGIEVTEKPDTTTEMVLTVNSGSLFISLLGRLNSTNNLTTINDSN